MIKKLIKQKNSTPLVFERPILELLKSSRETAFEAVTDGHALILTPIKDVNHSEKVRQSINNIGKSYAKSFEELAK